MMKNAQVVSALLGAYPMAVLEPKEMAAQPIKKEKRSPEASAAKIAAAQAKRERRAARKGEA